jgi:hypothetical protein
MVYRIAPFASPPRHNRAMNACRVKKYDSILDKKNSTLGKKAVA